jgi:hypothetical protein
MSEKGVFFERELNGVMKDFCRIEIAGVRDVWEGPARPEDIQRFPESGLLTRTKRKSQRKKALPYKICPA